MNVASGTVLDDVVNLLNGTFSSNRRNRPYELVRLPCPHDKIGVHLKKASGGKVKMRVYHLPFSASLDISFNALDKTVEFSKYDYFHDKADDIVTCPVMPVVIDVNGRSVFFRPGVDHDRRSVVSFAMLLGGALIT